MRSKCVEVEIVGGLGNQLFGLAAGLFLARKTSAELKLNLSQIGIGGTNHGKSIRDFDIPEAFFSETTIGKLKPNIFGRLSNKIAREFPLYKKIRDTFNKIYSASELGFERDFELLNQPRYIKGYFQTHLYPDAVKDELSGFLTLKRGSDWYLNKLKEISETKPIAIHIRRGDYLKLKEEFGVLDIRYYSGLIANLTSTTSRSLWIFTDSPELVQIEVEGTSLHEATIIEPPQESSPSESMLLISECDTIVMSNSTYSWWAAYLSKDGTAVYAPDKWFKGRKDPEKLIPPSWNKIESLWLEKEDTKGGFN